MTSNGKNGKTIYRRERKIRQKSYQGHIYPNNSFFLQSMTKKKLEKPNFIKQASYIARIQSLKTLQICFSFLTNFNLNLKSDLWS